MFGHKVPAEIFEYLEKNSRAIVTQEKGKMILQQNNSLEYAVAVFLKKEDDEVFSLTEDERKEMNNLKLPFVTVGSNKDYSESFIPNRFFEDTKFDGRPFIHGIFDCYTLVKDYYRKMLGIYLPTNIQRTWEWWLNGENLYLDSAKTYNFHEVTDIKPNDIILMKLTSDVPNHAAIYVGCDTILHHVSGRFSTYEELSHFYKHKIAVIYRNTNIQNGN